MGSTQMSCSGPDDENGCPTKGECIDMYSTSEKGHQCYHTCPSHCPGGHALCPGEIDLYTGCPFMGACPHIVMSTTDPSKECAPECPLYCAHDELHCTGMYKDGCPGTSECIKMKTVI